MIGSWVAILGNEFPGILPILRPSSHGEPSAPYSFSARKPFSTSSASQFHRAKLALGERQRLSEREGFVIGWRATLFFARGWRSSMVVCSMAIFLASASFCFTRERRKNMSKAVPGIFNRAERGLGAAVGAVVAFF